MKVGVYWQDRYRDPPRRLSREFHSSLEKLKPDGRVAGKARGKDSGRGILRISQEGHNVLGLGEADLCFWC